jgi:hypothetical protein
MRFSGDRTRRVIPAPRSGVVLHQPRPDPVEVSRAPQVEPRPKDLGPGLLIRFQLALVTLELDEEHVPRLVREYEVREALTVA